MQEQPQGRLRLTVAGAFAEEYIPPAAVDYMQQFPGMVVELDFSNRVVDLIAEGYDLAIRAGALQDSSLIARRLADRNLHIVASRDYVGGVSAQSILICQGALVSKLPAPSTA